MELEDLIRVSFQHAGGGSKKREFYVYVHRDPQGRVFYVGKGKKRRAWEKEGHNPLWHSYVDRFNGDYEVEVIRSGLNEDEAMWLEEDVMKEYGGQLVNWVNMHRAADYEASERYWEVRREMDVLLQEARALQELDKEKAVELHRQALARMKESQSVFMDEYFTGLALKLYQELMAKARADNAGKVWMLNLLVTCLMDLGRHEEALLETKQYLNDFPDARTNYSFKRIAKRVKLPLD